MQERDELGDETLDPNSDVRGSEPCLVLLLLAPGGIRSFELSQRVITVGRAPTSDVFIDHASVSRAHAQLRIEPGHSVSLSDLGSRNGTTLNGERLGEAAVAAQIGDRLAFGDINAQLQLVSRLPAARVTQWLAPEELDRSLIVEAERALRFGQAVGFLRIDLAHSSATGEQVREVVPRMLRFIDLVTQRAPGRFDLLLPSCQKEPAVALGRRIHAVLHEIGAAARIGVALYPGDAPTPDSLPLAAQLAMHGVDDGVGAAQRSARMLRVGSHEVVVAEPEMVRLFALVERAANAPMPVLIHGETGTGKEIVAEALHSLGGRAAKPLVRLNCAAVTETLLESELFGHERGAFSGAVAAKPGLIEQAHGGTLFLDEIAEMSAALQAKLLRVLEDHTVRRVGAIKDQRVDIRLVAASHRDLGERVANGQFRQDLYYRLNSLVLHVPPLRQRRREILLLAERFIAREAKETRRPQLTLSPAAGAALAAYGWPGNVRELRNVMRRAVMMAERDSIDLEHLPPELAAAPSAPVSEPNLPDPPSTAVASHPPIGIKAAVEQLEREMIVSALREHRGNQTRAAARLGITRQALSQKLVKYRIDPSE